MKSQSTIAAPVRNLRSRLLAAQNHSAAVELRMCVDETNWEEDETLKSDAYLFATLRDRNCNMPQIRQSLPYDPSWTVKMNSVHLALSHDNGRTLYCPLDQYLQRYAAIDCQSDYQRSRGVQLLSLNRSSEQIVVSPLQFCPVSAEAGSPHKFSIHVRNASLFPGNTLVLISRVSTGTMSFVTLAANCKRGTEIFERQLGVFPVRFSMPKQPELFVVVQIPLLTPDAGQKPLLHRDLRYRMHVTMQIVYPEDYWVLNGNFFHNIDLLFTSLQYKRRHFPRAVDFPEALAMQI